MTQQAKVTIAIEYVWCSGVDTHHDLRSKVKTMLVTPAAAASFQQNAQTLTAALPVWNFDGSSTGQAKGKDTEVLLHPRATFPHPFMKSGVPSFVTLAECHLPREGGPTPDNTRSIAASVFDAALDQKPWFGLEQEYVLYKDGRPLGWPEDGTEPTAQGQYYCGSGAASAVGRKYAVKHYETCLLMGLKLSGLNAEVMPGQWEYQVGPCEGIEAGDHALLARWVYLRLCEDDGVDVNFDSKPKKGDWNGSGMHCNFSTEEMRQPGGLTAIQAAIDKLALTFMSDVAVYGSDNIERLTGKHETSRLDKFNCDVGTRTTSCRIPNQVKADGHGYFEDRRPSSSADPYLVSARLFASSCGVSSTQLDAKTEACVPDWLKKMIKGQANN